MPSRVRNGSSAYSAVALYPRWQAFLREHRPQTLIFWGQHDLFFTPEGTEAYLADLPEGVGFRHRSITTSPRGCEQQVSRLPSAGASRGSGR
jgi:hypothetical protein